VVLHFLHMGVVAGGADDLGSLVERQHIGETLLSLGCHGDGVVEVGGMGRGFVAAETEDVGVSDKLYRVDGVLFGIGTPDVAEVASLPPVDILVGVACLKNLRVVTVDAELVAIPVRTGAEEVLEGAVFRMSCPVAGETGEGAVLQGPAGGNGDSVGNLSQRMDVGGDQAAAVTAVAELDGILQPERISLSHNVTPVAEALAVVRIDS
jgi:hypothetical protein